MPPLVHPMPSSRHATPHTTTSAHAAYTIARPPPAATWSRAHCPIGSSPPRSTPARAPAVAARAHELNSHGLYGHSTGGGDAVRANVMSAATTVLRAVVMTPTPSHGSASVADAASVTHRFQAAQASAAALLVDDTLE